MVASSVAGSVSITAVRSSAGGSSSGGARVPDFYVDSVSGSNANDGLTALTAKQTIAAASALLSVGKYLSLAKGSTWLETFTFAHNSLLIGQHGTGAMPILDCRDAVPASWTQPDNITYPDVWSISWTRAQAASTGSAYVNLWVDGESVRLATTLADLQTNGGAHYVSRTATTTTISIKSATNPNSNGVSYKASTRGWGFKGHSVTLGSAAPTNQVITGPIEVIGAIEHYNGVSGGPGQIRRVLVLDGNIHHFTTESDLTEDCVAFGTVPGIGSSMFVAYRSVGTGFSHVFRRCLALSAGGTARAGIDSSFYAHASSPTTIDSLTIEQCAARATNLNGDAAALTVTNFYGEEGVNPVIGASSTNLTIDINRVQIQDLTVRASVNGSVPFKCLSSVPAITIENFCAHTTKGTAFIFNATATPPNVSYTALTGNEGGMTGGAGALAAPLTLNNSILTTSGRCLNLIVSPYVGDFNVFMWTGGVAPIFGYNAGTYSSLSAFQAATGQDANSVYLKPADQVAGSSDAFWYGVANSLNDGPVDGEWRINPTAKVYNGAGTALYGTFADGVTPITEAGPQEHWNFNTRAVVAGPPSSLVAMPTTKAECRTYMNDIEAWDFYP